MWCVGKISASGEAHPIARYLLVKTAAHTVLTASNALQLMEHWGTDVIQASPGTWSFKGSCLSHGHGPAEVPSSRCQLLIC